MAHTLDRSRRMGVLATGVLGDTRDRYRQVQITESRVRFLLCECCAWCGCCVVWVVLWTLFATYYTSHTYTLATPLCSPLLLLPLSSPLLLFHLVSFRQLMGVWSPELEGMSKGLHASTHENVGDELGEHTSQAMQIKRLQNLGRVYVTNTHHMQKQLESTVGLIKQCKTDIAVYREDLGGRCSVQGVCECGDRDPSCVCVCASECVVCVCECVVCASVSCVCVSVCRSVRV